MNGQPMRKVHFIGEFGYGGMDPATRERFRVGPGETVVVSEQKAEQLFKDFPEEWRDRGPFDLQPAVRAANVTYPVVSPEHTT